VAVVAVGVIGNGFGVGTMYQLHFLINPLIEIFGVPLLHTIFTRLAIGNLTKFFLLFFGEDVGIVFNDFKARLLFAALHLNVFKEVFGGSSPSSHNVSITLFEVTIDDEGFFGFRMGGFGYEVVKLTRTIVLVDNHKLVLSMPRV
jgi:hypothetical protein